jgi:phosphatidylinositol alpha-1,6-mannosyltransferase
MHILFTADYFLPHAGGSRVYYYNLYKRIADRYPDQLTILTKKVPGWQDFDTKAGRERLRIIRHFKPLPSWSVNQLPKIAFPLANTLAQVIWRRVDILHPGDLYPQGVIARWMKEVFGIPYIAYCHGEDITLTDRYQYQPRVRNWIYEGADAVVAACEFAKQNLVRIGVAEHRIVKITPGVDFNRFSPMVRKVDLIRRYGLAGRKVLLTVARLCPRKGHDKVIRAIAKLSDEFHDLTYLIVGLGPEQKKLRQLVADLGLDDIVKFTGYVPDDELNDFYNLCDVFVMANQKQEDGDIEGFGMVLLEANAVGKPVIAGSSGGTADSVLDGITGYRVNVENIHELTAAIRRLLTNPGLCGRVGKAGLQRAREEFGWDKRAALLRELSLNIVQGKMTQSEPADQGSIARPIQTG